MPAGPDARPLRDAYGSVRGCTLELASRLTPEDMQVQSMPDASPAKWHLGHTSWFFEAVVLGPHLPGYAPFHPLFGVLFNSYYESLGPRHERPMRGVLSRPGAEEILAYRAHVDRGIDALLERGPAPEAMRLVELGLHHEQQHQELLLTDIHHALSLNPLRPAYGRPAPPSARPAPPLRFLGFDGGVYSIGADGSSFSYDNERPRHRVFLERFELASRAVTCGEYLEFISDGGYRRPELWLSDGLAEVRSKGLRAPLFWEERDGSWSAFTLGGMRALDPAEPACHLSYFEADAYARWAGARLPTEAEWEVAAAAHPVGGNLQESGRLHPQAAGDSDGPSQLFGDVWEWTQSAYAPYPGFRPEPGAAGEYNAKFMVSQLVLRGGSCLTPRSHLRASYRNYFPPGARWQFTGVRLARGA